MNVFEIAPISCLGLHEPNVKGLILFNVDIHTPTCVQCGNTIMVIELKLIFAWINNMLGLTS